MEPAITVTDLERALASVNEGEDPYEVALKHHEEAEEEVKNNRVENMKQWKKDQSFAVREERRAFLDVQRQSFLMNPDLKFFCLRNMTDTVELVADMEGEETATTFGKEQVDYNTTMRAHEERFEYRNRKQQYIDTRTHLMSTQYYELDTKMKKVKPTWNGYHDLLDETISAREKSREHVDTINKLMKEIKTLKHANQVLNKCLTTEMEEIFKDPTEEQEHKNNTTKKKRRKKKRLKLESAFLVSRH